MSWSVPSVASGLLGTVAQVHYPHDLWMWHVAETGAGVVWLVYSAFWAWMLWHCVRTEPDRHFWLWLLIIVPGVGPVAYFFLRYLPAANYQGPAFLRRWTRGRELLRLETAAIQIGNSHQFIQWGDALRDVGMLDQAATAYDRALAKEPASLQALWGAAQVAAAQNRHEEVCQWTRQILDKDPQYKFGDVSLAYSRSLIELDQTDAAMQHLQQHVRRWRHPEAVYLLASLHVKKGETAEARRHLQALLHDINGSPSAIARRHGRWKSRARQLLRKLA